MMNTNAGLVSLGAYIPAKPIPNNKKQLLSDFLREQTSLPIEYSDYIAKNGCLPGRIETNEEGWAQQPWFDSWLQKIPPKNRKNPFLGTTERRLVPLDPVSQKNSVHVQPMLSSDAETLAGALAIFNAQMNPDAIDMVIVKSLTPDRFGIPSASLVQHKLGLSKAEVFDLNSGCSSFATMLDIATAMVKARHKRNILIVDSSLAASYLNDKSQPTSVLLGDAVVAGIVGEVESGYGHLDSEAHSDGSMHDAILLAPAKLGSSVHTDLAPRQEQWVFVYNNPLQCKQLFQYDEEYTVKLSRAILERNDMQIDDVDCYVTTQPFYDKGSTWRQLLGISETKFYESFKSYANCMSSALGINLIEAIENGLINAGSKVLLTSPGAGANIVAMLYQVSPKLVQSVNFLNINNKEND